ncbi:hypothetical protein SISSUDRAFT_1047446 [Sistotremastrum suecicum HHB10207 ss-3]|uniref:Uncharacterized protein n=1 Tax=Sistotremastrum suecicum HHB10207 ss-3 TaxID=1314776 RepID=A0A166D729_9AGAM|nr:hypothetical protein SISSUDRAFT_1047446 [Sistotremastrum suecicum HHB10207 ss-3]
MPFWVVRLEFVGIRIPAASLRSIPGRLLWAAPKTSYIFTLLNHGGRQITVAFASLHVNFRNFRRDFRYIGSGGAMSIRLSIFKVYFSYQSCVSNQLLLSLKTSARRPAESFWLAVGNRSQANLQWRVIKEHELGSSFHPVHDKNEARGCTTPDVLLSTNFSLVPIMFSSIGPNWVDLDASISQTQSQIPDASSIQPEVCSSISGLLCDAAKLLDVCMPFLLNSADFTPAPLLSHLS